jgi:DNA-directed RNA polymerase subunit K/omega
MNNVYLNRAKQVIPDPQILSVVAAKRARQLATGARPMIKCDMTNLLDVALLEIAEGLLSYEFGADAPAEEAAPAAEETAAPETPAQE